jgi:uncharacterized protein involved in exopolysaccharide biosynthesis/Mrp family chromosome partitioning ATPase
MNNNHPIEPPPGINLGDIYFVVFRHKWKIVITTILGMAAAVTFYFTKTPPFQSEAKLFIRYISDSHSANPSDINTRVTSLTEGETIMNSEMEILKSFDLAEQVATNVGPEKILAKVGGGDDPMAAASVIYGGLQVEGLKDSSVIHVIFRHPDPSVVRPVLAEIITDYLEKHLQVHRAIGLSDDSLTEETTQLRMQIKQTEDELRIAKTNAGIISIEDSEKTYGEEMARIKRDLFQAETEMAEHKASLNELAGRSPNKTGDASLSDTNIPAEDVAKYKTACAQMAFAQKREDDYLFQQGYTPENKLVVEARAQKTEATKTKQELEDKYPSLLDMDVSSPPSDIPSKYGDTDARLSVSLPVRIQSLKEQLKQIQSEAATLDTAEAQIADLTRKKQIQEQNFKYYATTLEQDRIDQALGPGGRGNNISEIQSPSPAFKAFGKFYKTIFLLFAGGVGIGVGWAFLIEFVLDRSIKRPVDIQSKLHIPFFLSIPDLNQNSRTRLAAPKRALLAYNGNGKAKTDADPVPVVPNGAVELTSSEVNRRLQSHYDALRDRLVVYFEAINLTRKPKLVAVTSTHEGAGVSTIAAGLAASLSETGDGRVLLVDMNLEHGAAQQFFNGKPSLQIDDALHNEKRDSALVQENLYVVSEGDNTQRLPRALPKRFASLIPKLKASDYDYIIFDMPPVSPTSVTTRLAGYMDTVMLVVEAEKSDTQVTQQANVLLKQANANVTAVLNKTRKYIPSALHKDMIAGEQF